MKIYDMHIHTYGPEFDVAGMLAEMEAAGVWGGCIFSPPPCEFSTKRGMPFRERLDRVLAITQGYDDRLFPVLWIHPDEEDILARVKVAAAEGIAGFKVICNDFYPCEDKCMALWRAIAALDKPVFFHTGILYSSVGQSHSEYSRPIHFERLEEVEGLRFSIGHCGWPWIDECLALYGRMSYHLTVKKEGENPPEMFLDLTPGAPLDRREEMLKKVYLFGQNTGNNILFGTDQVAERYHADGTRRWLEADRKIYDTLGIRRELREKTYEGNLMRFLGKKEYRDSFVLRIWGTTPYAKDTAAVIEKWYKKLAFPKEYDTEFYAALKRYHISDAITFETYDLTEQDGKRNLLSFLYFCEELARKYEERGIPEEVLLDTLKDLVLWTDAWSDVKGELYLGELIWLAQTMRMRLFRLGSLEFMANKAHADCEALGLRKGDPIVEVHIPAGADLSPEAVRASLDAARAFYAKHFPEYTFAHFTCHSWLLDPSLDALLPETSNILKFRDTFTPILAEESDAALRYVFRWSTTRRNLRHAAPSSSFAERMKKYALAGGVLHEAMGAIRIEN
jgi:predicted TIM-barrel fold metal-dependent hydrolase